MNIEHIGYMVEQPAAVAAWYVEHLGFTVKRSMDVSPFGHFLADGSGRVMIEIYNNPKVRTPDYRAMDPLLLHLAFAVVDVAAERARLMSAGAAPVGDIVVTGDGDRIAMLRDPWGFPIQLCRRAQSMTAE